MDFFIFLTDGYATENHLCHVKGRKTTNAISFQSLQNQIELFLAEFILNI